MGRGCAHCLQTFLLKVPKYRLTLDYESLLCVFIYGAPRMLNTWDVAGM